MKKLTKGLSDYESIIDNNCFYVDKTEYIERLENLDDHYIMFLRPRKFGKTLFTSVLENYYDINKKDKFDYLFSNTYIGKNPSLLKNKYYILKFNFSGIDTTSYESTIVSFKNKVIIGINNFIDKYNFDFKVDENKESEVLLNQIFSYFKGLNLENKIYVIIDEYDHFANDLLSFNLSNFKDLVTKNGKVRKFYEALKEGTESVVDRIFITGVAPITLDSLTSGFNITSNITRDPRFNNLCGFNEDEVISIMDYLELSKEEKEYIKPIMKEFYDGYKFSIKGDRHIYNSNMCLYFLSYYSDFNDVPESLIDSNIASDYKKLEGMFNLYKGEDRKDIIERSMSKGGIISDIVDYFSVKETFELKDFVSNLFYLGYLTIDGDLVGTPILKIPNEVMRRLYSDYFLSLVNKKIGGSSINYPILKSELALNGDINKIVDTLEYLLERLSNRDYQNFDEKYVKILFYSIVQNFDDTYIVKSEYEVYRKYPDLYLRPIDNSKGYYTVMIEFKYLKKSDEDKLGVTLDKAKEQLIEYSSKDEFKVNDNFRKYALVCVSSKVYFEEIV